MIISPIKTLLSLFPSFQKIFAMQAGHSFGCQVASGLLQRVWSINWLPVGLMDFEDVKDMATTIETVPSKKKTTKDETDVYRCFYCEKKKHRTAFHKHTAYYRKSGISPICRQCAANIANRVEYGVANGVTVESMMLALRLMDKPFIGEVFKEADRAYKNVPEDKRQEKSLFGHYITLLGLTKYGNCTWEDTEFHTVKEMEHKDKPSAMLNDESDEIKAEAEINRKDCLRLIGYDPFLNEAEEDKPFLYSQLIKYLDLSSEANEDAMKVSSIIQIVKTYNQASKINDAISDIMSDQDKLLDNAATLKSLQSTQKTMMDTALSLAKDNGISFAHNNNNSKGANTLSGKLKKMKELDLREIEVNAFDIGTAEGMRQVADISNASILEQIRLNENDIPEMIADQRILIEKWERAAFKASEQARILLRENQDLKSYLEKVGHGAALSDRSYILDDDGGVNTPDIYEDDFQKMMREGGSVDVWELEENQAANDVLGERRVDVEYEDEDDLFEVDPDDIIDSGDEVENGGDDDDR